MPTGSSIGAMIMRPNVSADKRRKAPMTAVNGNTFICRAPTNRLEICGQAFFSP